MLRSWIVRIWAFLLSAQSLIIMVSINELTIATETISGLLSLFPLVWSTIIIVLCSGAIASESGVVADSILSKAVRRSEYIVAKLCARSAIIITLYLATTVPAAYLVAQNGQGTVDSAGVVWAFTLIGLILLLLTTLTVAASTLFNRTLVAVIVMWFVWYAAGAITGILNAEYLSPLAIVDSLPGLLAGDFETDDLVRSVIGYVVLLSAALSVALFHFTRKDV